MHLPRRAVFVATFAALATIPVSSAFAAQLRLLPERELGLTADDTAQRSCAIRNASGAGVAREAVTAPMDGVISVRTSGARSSDWDIGIVDRKTGNVLNGAAGPDANEVATTRVAKGQELDLKACRLSGARRVDMTVQYTETGPPAKGDGSKVKLVRVDVRTPFDRYKLGSLGLDTTDHPAPAHQDVVVHSAADERKLQQAGFSYQVRQGDLLGHDRANRLREKRAYDRSRRPGARASQAAATPLPSGRNSYRTLPEINDELRALATRYPRLVRLVELPLRSRENRPILGIEIAENVDNAPDGRPVYVQIGTHHAREWPANEATLEFGIELIKNFTRDPSYNRPIDPRLDRIVREARTFVIPVMNVDGFDATIESEGLNPDHSFQDPVDSGPGENGSGDQANGSGAYKRKTCFDPDPAQQPIPCLARTSSRASANPSDLPAQLPDRGVDPNRNYGVEWGGPGTSDQITDLTNAGPRPWSEPETESVRRLLRDLQPTVLITNHTYTGLILRPPGTSTFGPVPDEDRLRALGDAMAAQTNYISQFSYQLYDTTGTTDDYIYDGLGGFSYTPEIGKVEFHPEYSSGFVPEYDGRPALDPNGNPTGPKLGGLREAYTLAGLTASDPDSHSLIRGTAPAGRTLRISKTISYKTSGRPNDDPILHPQQTITEPRTSTMVVPPSGQFEWHVNPSSQPRSGETTPWRLTCEDGAGRVLETRDVYVARDQATNVGLTCGATTAPPPPPTQRACVAPDGFRSVNVSRRGRGLRIRFARKVRNPVTVDIVQTSIGRRIVRDRRVVRFTKRSRSFNWSGRGARKRRLRDGTFYVRVSIRDAARRADVRRVAVERKRGKFSKRGAFELVNRCA